jgi:hypothetical protein
MMRYKTLHFHRNAAIITRPLYCQNARYCKTGAIWQMTAIIAKRAYFTTRYFIKRTFYKRAIL